MLNKFSIVLLYASSANISLANQEPNLETVKSLAGCYAVDYSYSEIKAIKDGYSLDPRAEAALLKPIYLF